jgi:hypothetical protein
LESLGVRILCVGAIQAVGLRAAVDSSDVHFDEQAVEEGSLKVLLFVTPGSARVPQRKKLVAPKDSEQGYFFKIQIVSDYTQKLSHAETIQIPVSVTASPSELLRQAANFRRSESELDVKLPAVGVRSTPGNPRNPDLAFRKRS